MSKSNKPSAASTGDDLAEADRLAAENAEADRLAAENAEADRLAAEKTEADRLAAEKAESDRLAAEKAEADQRAARLATLRIDVLLLRREYIDGTWYPAGAVLFGVPARCVRSLVADGAVDAEPEALRSAIESGAQRLTYVPPEPPDEVSED